MKLLTKTSIYFIGTTAILFVLNALIIYRCILLQFDSEVDEHLSSSKKNIVNNLKNGYSPEEIIAKTDKTQSIKEIKQQTLFEDRYIISYQDEENEEHQNEEDEIKLKTLVFQTAVQSKIYEIKITSSLTESSEIGEPIIYIVVICLFCSLLILFILNRLISKFIWAPFNATLLQIKQWGVKNENALQLKKTNINEFNSLNQILNDLTIQIKTDFLNLKEFTENVSHEAQTPLAILSNKLELLLQEKNYSLSQKELLHQSYQAVQRLYKLNKALVFLSRIENKQFIDTESINLNKTIDDKIIEMEDFIEANSIIVYKEFNEDYIIKMNRNLLNVLLDNLFNNSIKYNITEGGIIRIKICSKSFSFENTSNLLQLNEQQLFDRTPIKSTSNSLGVGLSLIKKISDLYNWNIKYSFFENKHKFEIYF